MLIIAQKTEGRESEYLKFTEVETEKKKELITDLAKIMNIDAGVDKVFVCYETDGPNKRYLFEGDIEAKYIERLKSLKAEDILKKLSK